MTQHGQSWDFVRTTGSQSVSSQSVSKAGGGSSSSTTTTKPRSRACCTPHDLEVLRDAYETNVGLLTGVVQMTITNALEMGMELAVILDAINTTAWASRPSARYFAAILRRYQAAGIMTMDDVIRDNDQHEQRIQTYKRRRSARWYDEPQLMTQEDAAYFDPY